MTTAPSTHDETVARGANRTRVAAIVLLVLAWGSTFAAVKIGLDGAPPVLFGGMRSVLGGGLMTLLALWRSGPPRLRETWPAYVVLTLLNVVLFFTLQTLAILELPSGLAAVLIYLQPVLTGVLAVPLLGESMTRLKLLGLLLGFAGIVVVSAGALQGHVSVLGVGYAVVGALVWALGTIAFKRYAGQVDAWWAVAVPFLVGGIVLCVGGGAVEGTSIDWSGRFVAAFVYASIVGTAMSWSLWFGLVGAGEAGRAASYIFFVPLVSLVIGGLLLHESLGLSLLVGAALVILGVYLVNRRGRGAVG
ncbi:MAG: DMT family transporter [Nocardioidaceae bacterium]|nr:DMT family transporter [Nocardioidaceae bacterium]NUS52812.1 DMT family transporter [Nocardioidaceae bacterium]